jgi:flagellar L-ring protein precursor FlgH
MVLIAAQLSLLTGGLSAQSLYDERTFKAPAADVKARRVGDVLTVQVVENAAASANTDTGTRRKNGLSAGITHPAGVGLGVGMTTSGEFDGGGQTARAGKLVAQLTVSVKEVLGNGDLRVAGEQSLLINEELQRINLEGRVRPQDISDANVVLSTRIGDAKITYVGEGDLATRQKPAWWRQVLDWVGL